MPAERCFARGGDLEIADVHLDSDVGEHRRHRLRDLECLG